MATPIGFLFLCLIQVTIFATTLVVTIRLAMRRKRYALKWYNRAWIYVIAVIPILSVPMFTETPRGVEKVETYSLSSGSMAPTLRAGDYLIADQRSFIPTTVTAGDVVSVRYADRVGETYIIRIVGMPGDRIRLIRGVPEINGTLVAQEPVGEVGPRTIDRAGPATIMRETLPSDRSYLVTRRDDRLSDRTTQVVELGPDAFFTLGDNRENANDSTRPRPVGRGLLNRAEIAGIVRGIYWSSDLSRVGADFNTLPAPE